MTEFQQNPSTTFIFHFPVNVLMVLNNKVDNITIPSGNMIMIAISYKIILVFRYSVLLGGLELDMKYE